jgi:hypothetical protein
LAYRQGTRGPDSRTVLDGARVVVGPDRSDERRKALQRSHKVDGATEQVDRSSAARKLGRDPGRSQIGRTVCAPGPREASHISNNEKPLDEECTRLGRQVTSGRELMVEHDESTDGFGEVGNDVPTSRRLERPRLVLVALQLRGCDKQLPCRRPPEVDLGSSLVSALAEDLRRRHVGWHCLRESVEQGT